MRRKIRVDLDHAAVRALVPVVRAPRLAGNVFDGERFVLGKSDVLLCPLSGLGDRRREDGIEPVLRNNEILLEPLEPIEKRSLSGRHERIDPAERLAETPLVGTRRDGVVERIRFFIEGELRAFEHDHARHERFELLDQKRAPEPERLLFPTRIQLLQLRDERGGGVPDLLERPLFLLRLLAPLRRPEIGVDVQGIVLADGEGELHETLRDSIHGRLRLRFRHWTLRRRRGVAARNEHARHHDTCGRDGASMKRSLYHFLETSL
ncbi:MAG: hypothetical protein NTW97_08765 [Candidatus Krumholzibacteria bacterium]|nr:hypothetical protein [Candidatus Krumholzibacteria bacterium]